MKKTIIAAMFILSAAFNSLCFAQTNKQVTLESVCEQLASRPNTKGDFTQTKTLQTNGRKLKSTGKYIICSEGILWKTEKPVPSSLILTKDTMVQISANGNKSVMSGKDNQIFSNISETLSSVFSGNVEALKKNFLCEFSDNGNNGWTLVLTPKDSTIAAVMKSLELSGLSKPETSMNRLVMSEASGNTITYEFINQIYPKELSTDEKQNFIVE